MEVAYVNFWPSFDLSNNWFNCMFKEYFSSENIVFSTNMENADIVVTSIFGDYMSVKPKGKKIIFTGESHSISKSSEDILLGFNPTSVSDKIFRLPFWMTVINWWKDKESLPYTDSRTADVFYTVDVENLSRCKREEECNEFISREQFCAIVASNPVQNRMTAASLLSSISPVHGYGAAFGQTYEGIKAELLKQYKFNIAFENTLKHGYVTEKLFEAKLAGCIPIYWGSGYAHKDFNCDGFIDATTMNGDDLIAEIQSLLSSEQRMKEMYAQPMFKKPVGLDNLYQFLSDVGL